MVFLVNGFGFAFSWVRWFGASSGGEITKRKLVLEGSLGWFFGWFLDGF